MRIIRLFAFTPLMCSVLCADWKIVTRTGNSTVTEFLKGTLVRTDSSPVYSTVLDSERRRQLSWRSDLQQYTASDWPPAFPVPAPSGEVITIERVTTDSGERKQYFGRTARHLITRVTRAEAPETTIDGWYIDVPGLPKSRSGGSFAILTASVGGPPRIEVKQSGPRPDGLPVLQKTTSPGSRQTISEVSDLVETSLPDKLFQQPDGYQRVTILPYAANRAEPHAWTDLLRAHWQVIENWFSSVL